MNFTIRVATPADIAATQRIEIDAGRLFRDAGLDSIADDPPDDDATMLAYIRDGRAWTAVNVDGEAIGYAVASVVDNDAHLDQVSVAVAEGRKGVGTALIAAVTEWARTNGLDALTLTTFADLAFNGPYYRKLGFVEVPREKWGPELAAIRTSEIANGIDVAPRIAMRLEIQAS